MSELPRAVWTLDGVTVKMNIKAEAARALGNGHDCANVLWYVLLPRCIKSCLLHMHTSGCASQASVRCFYKKESGKQKIYSSKRKYSLLIEMTVD